MPHYNWYDLTAYEKAALIGSQNFPTYSGVGSPSDNARTGSPGDSYLDTQNDLLYFCIATNQWVAAGGGSGASIPGVIAGTECLNAYVVRNLAVGEVYFPVQADWTVQQQVGSALSITSDGNFVTSDEGNFSVFVQCEMNWTIPFVMDGTFEGPSVRVGIKKAGGNELIVEFQPTMFKTSFYGFNSMDSAQGPPIHYVPQDSSTPALIINAADDLQIIAPTPYPADQALQLVFYLYITNQ